MIHNVNLPTVDYWEGRPLTELTREELMAAIRLLAQEIASIRDQGARDRETFYALGRRAG